MRKTVFIMLMLAQSFLCSAQTAPDFWPLEPMRPNSSTNNIHIIGYVPKFLKLTLDFSQDEKARLVGFYQVHPPVTEGAKHTGLEFIIRSDKPVDLGTAIIISNIACSTLDPSCPEARVTDGLGIDATAPMKDRWRFEKVEIPGVDKVKYI